MPTKKLSKNISNETAPKRIVERLDRYGNGFSWMDRVLMDWGDGRPRESFIPGAHEACFVLPLLDDGRVVLVHQYRPFAGGWKYELPGGIREETDSEETAALRELEEETGYRAAELQKIFTYKPMMTLQGGEVHLYVARKLKMTAQQLDSGEEGLTVEIVTPTQLYTMVLDGTITDAMTTIATLVAKERGILKVEKKEFGKGHPG